MRLYVILVFVLVVLALSLVRQQSTNRLTFVVEDIAGTPIREASVHVQHWDLSGSKPGSIGAKPRLIQDGVATTDAQGRVRFELAPAVYEVFASAPGFGPAAATVGNGYETQHVFKLTVVQGDWMKVESPAK